MIFSKNKSMNRIAFGIWIVELNIIMMENLELLRLGFEVV